MGFAFCGEAAIKVDQSLVPAEGGRERCGDQGPAQATATAGDVTLAPVFAAVVIEWSKPREGSGFFAADLTEFGHADDERQRRALADAGNAQHQIEASCQIVMGPKMLGNEACMSRLACLQPFDVAGDDTP